MQYAPYANIEKSSIMQIPKYLVYSKKDTDEMKKAEGHR